MRLSRCQRPLRRAPRTRGAAVAAGAAGEPAGSRTDGAAAAGAQANAARWRERCEREFQALRKERLATAELECQKLVNAAAAHLTQARPLT